METARDSPFFRRCRCEKTGRLAYDRAIQSCRPFLYIAHGFGDEGRQLRDRCKHLGLFEDEVLLYCARYR